MCALSRVPVSQDGRNLVLLPYTRELVPTYHGWMQDPKMLELTESEPLTLEQEYINQESWKHDPTKYCFIIHSRRPVIRTFQDGPGVSTGTGIDYTVQSAEELEALKKPVDVKWIEEPEGAEEEGQVEESTVSTETPMPDTEASSASTGVAAASAATSVESAAASPADPYPLTPIGDVNLFLHPDFNLEDYGIAGGGCEIEIMIAESSYRRRGLGYEALQLLMQFSAEQLGVERFVVKVIASNKPSIDLFQKKLGFRLVEYVECFDEMVLFYDSAAAAAAPEEDETETSEQTSSQLEENMSRLHTDDTVTHETSSSTAATQTRPIHDLD